MMSRVTLNTVLARLTAALLLWAPGMLWLAHLSPPRGDMRLHAATAAALALIGAQVLSGVFVLPVAEPSPARFRVVPSSPNRPMLVAAVGVSSVGWSLARLLSGIDLNAVVGIVCGALALAVALRSRADPIWGTWLELVGEVLRVHCPRASDWSVPLAQAREIHLRPRDRSFLLLTPWPERDVFVPSGAALSRFVVTDHERLLRELAQLVPVKETPRLLASSRRARQGARGQP